MGIFTFKGGIHPYEGKELSKDKPITDYEPKGELVYPLSQHIGAPALPLVKKGDHVLVGQKIAEAGGFISAPIHATVSGTVLAIEARLTVSGAKCNSIIVENDGQYEEVTYPAVKPLEELTREEIILAVKEAGIVGMGGAGFPTYVKLSPKEPDQIRYVIMNCAECEPYLTSDYRRMKEEPECLVNGLRTVLKLFDNAIGIFAVEDNKPDCIALLQKLVEHESRMEVRPLKTKYPQGAERQLIYAATKIAINSSMLPADGGCVVINVDTAYSINRALSEGKPLKERIVTVTGNAIADPRNFRVPIGTCCMELVEAAGGFLQNPAKVISGGPMMGHSLFDLNVPIVKTSSAILCLTEDDVAKKPATACINCARCVSVCPSRLLPSKLADLSERHDQETFEKLNGVECCECGCCSYICPAKRSLTQEIKVMRKAVLESRRKK